MTLAEIDLIHMISNAGIVVQLVLLLLLFFSITSWAIFIFFWRNMEPNVEPPAESMWNPK